ncbi:uncharacterized protein A4U43_C05F4010 [Asparagus officinalis]|uniref:Ubiquitin-like domain-containing protein n=1 Tax=Asparagus officinalis TaxID=4686 RepID=A0A5P1EUM6_ASPOF|nr:UPF0769 protein C21orf59 homolog [Asparagus officinalis]XP_020268159.1 UPF0769 protein C21orf59 homolog [Asparagus officinalis]XP_020268160.1 UPF0769 protein C21orf59 homolog [Asparagus officinalis]ONK67810.1 uncharacterized protein A4U43_C05F4010 [Asparagus officinalis]
MVVIHVKGVSDDRQFLFDCSSNSSIDEITSSISEISNLQSQIQTLRIHLRGSAIGIDRLLSEAESYASKDQVIHRRALSIHILRDHVRALEKEVEAAHSKGLINDDVLGILSDCGGDEEIQLWWAGKELVRGKKLSEYTGENEKTKIIVRLKPACSD